MLWGLLEYLSSILFFFLHITSAGSFPKALTAAEEKKYLEQMAAGDHHARQKLIEHNLRLVAHIAKKYYADENDRDDLVSIGTVGLIKAVDSFDPTKGIRLSSYASRCIENEILMFFRSAKKTAQDVSLNDPIDTDKDGNTLTLLDTIATDDHILEDIDLRMKVRPVVRRGEDPSFAARARDHFAALRAYGPAAACAARGRKKAEHFPQLCLAP